MAWTAAWAGWLTSQNPAPDQPVIITMHRAQLFLASATTTSINADMVRFATLNDAQGPLQTTTLEGHVHLTITSPTDEPTSPQTIIVETSRAVLVGHSDGTSVVQVDEATMQTVLPPQFLFQGNPQILPQALMPTRLTPQLKDADISQAAAAVTMATHHTFVIDPRVQGRLTMVSTTPMTPEAFDQAFLEILRTRGFVAMPFGPAANAIKILPGTTGP
jgi:hypothetical protein